MVSKDEIKEMEDAGLDVIAINESGKIVYNSAKNSNPNFCDNCRHLRVLPDPDPDDWFNDDDQKVVCGMNKKTIYSMLRPYEVRNITCPTWCPGKQLNKNIYL